MSIHGNSEDHNRLELLLFRLDNQQLFGINVLKIKEIINCPALTQLPDANPMVRGLAELRGTNLPVIDLAMAIGRAPVNINPTSRIIISEFNRTTQGFLISSVDRIVISDWKDVLPPPKGVSGGYITGVIRSDNNTLIQIIDVERILGEVIRTDNNHSDDLELDHGLRDFMSGKSILVVDDSSIARSQTSRTLEQLGIDYLTANDGREALDIINEFTEGRSDLSQRMPMVISDIEMPEMDGYHLTEAIKKRNETSRVYVLLHTSLDGNVNKQMAERAGADGILTKFVPTLLLEEIERGLRAMIGRSQ